jgi:hypothetical protein
LQWTDGSGGSDSSVEEAEGVVRVRAAGQPVSGSGSGTIFGGESE